MLLFLDFETRSKVDLKKVGSRLYAKHPSTEVISVSWCKSDGPVHHSPHADDLTFGAEDVLVAHNYSFERDVLAFVLRRPHSRWCDTMALAAQLSLPLSLEKLAEFFGFKKNMEGHRVMKKLSRPRRPSKDNLDEFWERDTKPEDFDLLDEYNRDDVEVMRECWRRMLPLTKREHRIWAMTEKMNERGIPIDVPAVLKAKTLVDAESSLLDREFTSLAGCSPRSSKAVATVLGLPDAKADTIKKAVAEDNDPTRSRLLELRQLLSKSSVAKLDGFLGRSDDDNRLRGSFVYAGAQRTGRWASRGVQLHNIPRGVGKATEPLFDLLHSGHLDLAESPLRIMPDLLRGFILGPLLVGDYAQIEARVLSWLAGDDEMSEEFAKGGDPYVLMASQVYRVPREKVTKEQRFLGKQAVLGCGYGMGPAKFRATCDKLSGGKTVPTMEEAKRIVDLYRYNRPLVKEFWYKIEGLFHSALDGTATRWFQGVRVGDIPYIRCVLPSGRCLYYAKPGRAWEVDPKSGRSYLVIRHYGQDLYTRQWGQVKTYGGKLVENIVQAVSRDILADAMLRLEDYRYQVLLTVHDEIGALDEGQDIEHFEEVMSQPPDWARGLPIGVEVFRARRYRK